jgi:EAL domain-containing protein (putative c-di-GMP-specific phosphodiesterase class I)
MPVSMRLLGFAFAASDLLVEMAPGGMIVFAMGSGPSREIPAETLVGLSIFDGVGKDSAKAIEAVLAKLTPGTRSPAVELLFTAGDSHVRRASARLFLLPDLAPNISTAVTWDGPAYLPQDAQSRPALTPAAFLDRARDILTASDVSRDLAISFVDVQGLQAAGALGEAGERLNTRVQGALQAASVDGNSAGQLGPEQFAVVRDRSIDIDLADEVREIGRSEGQNLDVRSIDVGIDASGDSLNALRALRFAVEGCLKDGGLDRPELTFSAALERTLKSANAFRTMVRDGGFELHYQPIVDLKTGAVHHFEALARFRGTDATADTIHMAEELALIDSFDVVVAEKALSRLRNPGAGLLKIAVNVSGASLADDRYVQSILRMTAVRSEERRRLIVEVTESTAMADVEAANRRLGALRAAGIKVCLDDFGSGSASYDYLRRLSVDTVKIDGKFIEGVETDPRAQTMLGHLVELCGSLKVKTIAEMVETQAAADILRDLRVDYGQGWLFGKAEIEPRTRLQSVEPARQIGAVWG